ncbi:MAG TPA: hypothetical protein VLE20_16590 [Blastocatellia bacterium]|nr:hypothetical protein [Blastocatellia bacterium]
MKRISTALALFCVLAVGAVSAAGTDFSGTWVLDKAKSEGLQGPMADVDQTWVVTQDAKTLTVETQFSGGQQEMPAQKRTYNLDGSETTAEVTGRFPGKAALKAKWMGDGKILELNSVRNINVQGNDVTIKSTEHWELADDGKTLKVHRTTESPRGTQENKLTLTKK